MSPEPLNAGHGDTVLELHRVELMPAGRRHDAAAERHADGPRRVGRQAGDARRNGTSRMYAFDRHEVGLPGIPKNGVPSDRSRERGRLAGLTAMP